MEPYYQDNHIRIFNKDCRSMDELPDESAQVVVTSPPYYGLRKYSGDQELIWGGDNHCEHQWIDYKTSLLHENRNFQKGTQEEVMDEGRELTHIHKYSKLKASFCSLCGGWKGQLGLEPTPEMYVQHLIEIMREIKRVLRKDGVFFLNIGDSYATSSPGTAEMSPVTWQENGKQKKTGMTRVGKVEGLKPKDLCLVPFRLAIAAQEDGWWVRSVIIWSKLNPMPQSVKDRPSVSHEYILMLTKAARYYYDADAVREKHETFGDKAAHAFGPKSGYDGMGGQATQGKDHSFHPSGRNIRSVWTFPTVPFPAFKIDGKKLDHFAVFPEKLPELCIKSSTPEVGCCSKCGAPWTRIISRGKYQKHESERQSKAVRGMTADRSKHSPPVETKTIGWKPTCACQAARVPSLVLDPLMGAGTTLLVAKKLNRYAVGYELSQEYCKLAVERCRQQVLG